MFIFHRPALRLLLTFSLISGCGTQTIQTGSTEIEPETVQATSTKVTAREESKNKEIAQAAADIPERPLDEETMALLLEAEFALYRNDIEAALSAYEQLAQQTADPGIAKRAAEIALSTSDPFRALDAALLSLELAPNDNHALELAVRALARSAEVEGAWALINEHKGKTYEVRMMTAEAVRLATQMKDNYQLEWLLQQILDKYSNKPKDSEIQLALAMIYEAVGNFEKAALYSGQANSQKPEDLLALKLHANALLRSGQKEQASRLLSDWIKNKSEDAKAQISLAQLLVSFDQAAALPILEMLSMKYPWSAQILMSTAQLHLASDNQKAAIPYYQKLAQFGAFRNISLFNLGRIYEQKGELELASKYYGSVEAVQGVAEEGNIIFEASLRQARVEYQIGDANKGGHGEDNLENGAVLFEELRQLYPDQRIELIHEEARLLLSVKKLESAVEILSMGISDQPDSKPLLYSRSIAYERLGDVNAAIQDLTTILSFDDANPVALNALGYTLANRTDRYEEAYDLIDRALSIDPDDPAIIDSMGWVLYHLGRFEEALVYLQKAHTSMLDEEVISHLAQVLWKLDRSEEAKQLLDKGIINMPNSNLIPKTRKKLNSGS